MTFHFKKNATQQQKNKQFVKQQRDGKVRLDFNSNASTGSRPLTAPNKPEFGTPAQKQRSQPFLRNPFGQKPDHFRFNYPSDAGEHGPYDAVGDWGRDERLSGRDGLAEAGASCAAAANEYYQKGGRLRMSNMESVQQLAARPSAVDLSPGTYLDQERRQASNESGRQFQNDLQTQLDHKKLLRPHQAGEAKTESQSKLHQLSQQQMPVSYQMSNDYENFKLQHSHHFLNNSDYQQSQREDNAAREQDKDNHTVYDGNRQSQGQLSVEQLMHAQSQRLLEEHEAKLQKNS